MSIKYAILGILSCNPLTGYDLKKIIQDSPFMHWSGNNNQIYKSLTELLDEGLVTNEVHHQESSPSKKIYTITQEGLDELKAWVQVSPELPEMKKTFLVQLAWADLLNQDELRTLLTSYEHEIKMQIAYQHGLKRRGTFSPGRTIREKYLWDMIHQNIISSYENELEWLKKLSSEICKNSEEEKIMRYVTIEKNGKRYIHYTSAEVPIHDVQDALDLIGACSEYDTNLLMIQSEALVDDFFRLRTGIAGDILQKFVNYGVKAAVVVTDSQKIKGKFKELVAETNRGNSFRVFSNKDEAENWLLK